MRRHLNGLIMVTGSLAIIAIVLGLISHHEVVLRQEQVRARGLALANALARIPIERLTTTDRRLGPLSLIQASHGPSNFAYAAVIDPTGRAIDVVSQVGELPASGPLSDDPASWSRQRVVTMADGFGSIREFTAPVLEAGVLVAHVRIGYREADHLAVLTDSSFYLVIGLLILLVSPIAYAWLRREIRPLSEVVMALPTSPGGLEDRALRDAPPSQTIEAIANRFRSFCEEMDARSESMSRERMALLASSKLAGHERNRLQRLVDSVPDALLSLSSDGKVALANHRATSLLRKGEEDLIGAAPSNWCPTPELARLISRATGASGGLKRVECVEFTLGEGSRRHFLASLHPVPESDDVALVIRDISVEYAARETQTEFLGHMAHELKAPLNVISMYGESLLGPDGKDEAFRLDACNVIRDETDRLNGLINNIFSIGRIESGVVSIDRQRVRTREFLTDLFESTARLGDDFGLEYELKLADSMQPIFADKPLLSIAIKNLLTNATKYNRPGGKVVLEATDEDEGILIEVKDTGVGILDEDLEQVFEKFYRSEDDAVRKIAGHGLGLALVKEIVVLHGGEIRVQSEFGEGSTFSVFFSRKSAIFREEA